MRVVLPFKLDGQTLIKGRSFPKSVADGSKDSVVIKVDGVPDGCVAKGYFKLSWESNTTYDLTFDGDELVVDEYIVTLPSYANNKYIDYTFSFSVAIWEGDVERLTTNPVKIVVEKSNYSDETTNTPDIPESQYNKLAQDLSGVIDLATNLDDDVKALTEKVDKMDVLAVDTELDATSPNAIANSVVAREVSRIDERLDEPVDPLDIRGASIYGCLTPLLVLEKPFGSFKSVDGVVNYYADTEWYIYSFEVAEAGEYIVGIPSGQVKITSLAADKATITDVDVGVLTNGIRRLVLGENTKYLLFALSPTLKDTLYLNKGTEISVASNYELPSEFGENLNEYGQIYPDSIKGVKNVGDIICRAKLLKTDASFNHSAATSIRFVDSTEWDTYLLKLPEERQYAIHCPSYLRLMQLDGNFAAISGTFSSHGTEGDISITANENAEYFLFSTIKTDVSDYHISVGTAIVTAPLYQMPDNIMVQGKSDTEVVQEVGDSETAVMSQKAVSELFKIDPLSGKTWENYTFLVPSDGGYGFSNKNNRISVREVFCFPFNVRISAADGYRYAVIYQSAEPLVEVNFVSETGWITEDTVIEAGQYFAFCCSRLDNAVMSVDEAVNFTTVGYVPISNVYQMLLGKNSDNTGDISLKALSKAKDISLKGYSGLSAEFVGIIQSNYNEFLAETKGDHNKIPFVVFTDTHESELLPPIIYAISDVVDWFDISACINLGDTVATNYNAEYLESYNNIMLEKIPLSRRIDVSGNHDFRNDSSNTGDYKRLRQYFLNEHGRYYGENNEMVFVDDRRNVKYIVLKQEMKVNQYGGEPHFGTAQMDFLVKELSKNDGYDIIILSHEPLVLTNTKLRDGTVRYPNESALPAGNGNVLKCGTAIMKMFADYKSKTNGTITDLDNVTHSYDFSNVTGELFMSLHGHWHCELYRETTDSAIPEFLFDSLKQSDYYPATMNGTFYFAYIDRKTNKFKCWRNCVGGTPFEFAI